MSLEVYVDQTEGFKCSFSTIVHFHLSAFSQQY